MYISISFRYSVHIVLFLFYLISENKLSEMYLQRNYAFPLCFLTPACTLNKVYNTTSIDCLIFMIHICRLCCLWNLCYPRRVSMVVTDTLWKYATGTAKYAFFQSTNARRMFMLTNLKSQISNYIHYIRNIIYVNIIYSVRD